MKNEYTFGVLGYRISYSRSAEIFQAISTLKHFDCSFEFHDIAPEDFDEQFPKVLAGGIDGFSVTIPHKRRVMQFLDQVDATAMEIGAVNSVCVKEGVSYGHNTDGYGFALPLEEHRQLLKGGTALVFGAGGAASAVIHSLTHNLGLRRFVVFGRNKDKLDSLAESIKPCLGAVDFRVITCDDYDVVRGNDYAIVVNCTPLGGWNHPDDSPFPEHFNWLQGRIYYDLSYNNNHKLIALAVKSGMIAIDGSTMLIGQALRSFELWTGQTVEFEPIYDAVFGAGRER